MTELNKLFPYSLMLVFPPVKRATISSSLLKELAHLYVQGVKNNILAASRLTSGTAAACFSEKLKQV